MRAFRFYFSLAGLALLSFSASTASALTLAEVQHLLKSNVATTVRFQESRESPWLDAPVESSGTMHSSAGMLEKRVTEPRKEIWRIYADYMEWMGPNATTKKILFSNAPEVASLASALRSIVAADLTTLERDYVINVEGNESLWSVRLQPRTSSIGRYLDHLELTGKASALEAIVVVERRGERTTTRFQR